MQANSASVTTARSASTQRKLTTKPWRKRLSRRCRAFWSRKASSPWANSYDEQTPLEDKALRTQIELAKEFELPIMIHTPHRDKRPGTLRTMDVLKEHRFDPARCVVDHNNEETIREVRDRGYWCAFSIYPNTKTGSERMAAIVESYGPERLIVDSACDWGVSDPLAVAETARLMAQRGVSADAIHQVVYANALKVYGLNTEMKEEHWLAPSAIDQRTFYEGNSVLRGEQTPRIEQSGRTADDFANHLSEYRVWLIPEVRATVGFAVCCE